MQKLIDIWFQLIKITSIIFLALMVVLVFGNVVLRYVFNSGITLSEEISRLLFIYITFLGAIIALQENLHLGIDSFVSRLSPQLRRLCLFLSQGLMLYVTWLILQGSWKQAVINIRTLTPVTGISMAVLYGAGILFSVATGILLIHNLLRAGIGRMSDQEVSLKLGISETPLEIRLLDTNKSAEKLPHNISET